MSSRPVIPQDATTLESVEGTISVYRDGDKVVLTGTYDNGRGSTTWVMNRDAASAIAAALIRHAITQEDIREFERKHEKEPTR